MPFLLPPQHPEHPAVSARLRQSGPWRREALRTTLWVVPTVEVVVAVGLFVVTYSIDSAASRGSVSLPAWVNNGSQGDFVPHVSIDHAGAFASYSSLTSASGDPGSLVGT